MENQDLTEKDVKKLNSSKGLSALLRKEVLNYARAIRFVDYEKQLKKLQSEVIEKGSRIIVLFEGRDAAGKGGAIRRATEKMNPRHLRIVALPKPTSDQKTQWYFQRYVEEFPKAGEIVFFDRSWYNRAVVEPVNGFCTKEEYNIFMNQVNDFERMIQESGTKLVKIYLSISKREQAKRFNEIKNEPLKQWKMTPVDEKAQELWDDYTVYKKEMFIKTNTENAPWKVIRANRKTEVRVNAIKHILKMIPYDKDREV